MARTSEDRKKLVEHVRKQVRAYRKTLGTYKVFAGVLKELLSRAVKDLGVVAIVQARAKDVSSFAEKISRKMDKYADPVNQLTDLCGARVITESKNDIERVCDFIRKHFEVDEANSENVQERLGVGEFGYQSVHFIVSLKREEVEELLGPELMAKHGGRKFKASLEELYKRRSEEECMDGKLPPGPRFKAEIQVRTLLQHAWAAFGHDRIYKSPFEVPRQWQRDANRIAATLEEADEGIARTIRGVDSYQNYYGAYMSRDQRETEVDRLEAVFELHDEKAPDWRLAHRIARLQISLENWAPAEGHLAGFVQGWERSPKGKRFKRAWRTVRQERDPGKIELGRAELERLRDPEMAAILLDFAWCKWKGGKTTNRRTKGRDYIQWAIDLDPANVDARVRMADTYMGSGPGMDRDLDTALEFYRQAFEVSPSDPRALGGFLHCKIALDRNLSFIPLVRPSLEEAIRQCRERARVGVYLPRAYYDIGLFALLMDRPYESLAAYAKAVQLSDSESPINKSLERITELDKALTGHRPDTPQLPELEWVRRFLLAAKVAKLQELARKADLAEQAKKTAWNEAKDRRHKLGPEDPDELDKTTKAVSEAKQELAAAQQLANKARAKAKAAPEECLRDLAFVDRPSFHRPVVFVAGGCDKSVEQKIREYRSLLGTAFQDFRGTICSGGTKAGISGLVGDLVPTAGGKIDKISYLPKGTETHAAYQVHFTAPGEFSAMEPLQNWIDLLYSETKPAEVRLLGINGGEISGFEFRMAVAFGAKVGVIPDSGRAASELLEDEDWHGTPGLLTLPFDCQTVRVFVEGPPAARFLEKDERETLAQDAHEEYRQEKRKRDVKEDPAMASWSSLSEGLKDSNRNQVDYIGRQLRAIRLTARKLENEPEKPYELSDEQVEKMAEIEHGRWNVERLLDGWTLGEQRDHKNKISPYLVPWPELPDDIKKYDRDAVKNIPGKLKKLKYDIIPLPAAGD